MINLCWKIKYNKKQMRQMSSIYNIIGDRDLIFLDLETTGLNIKEDRIVELCAIKYRKDKTKISFHKYFNPNKEVSIEAEKIHGLSNDFLKDYQTFDESADELYEFFKDCDLGGYNCASFDIPILYEELAKCNKQLDVFRINIIDSYILLSKYETRKLNDTYKRFFGEDIKDQHAAESDIKSTVRVFEKQVELYGLEEKNIKEISDIVRSTSNGDKLLDLSGWFRKDSDSNYLYNKGKHKDTLVKDNISYLRWLIDASDVEKNTKSVANILYKHFEKIKIGNE